jgi:hypothetical protein
MELAHSGEYCDETTGLANRLRYVGVLGPAARPPPHTESGETLAQADVFCVDPPSWEE